MGRPGTYKGGGEADPNMAAVRRRVLNATKAAGVKFLNACNEKNVIEQIKDGIDDLHGWGLARGGHRPQVHQPHRSVLVRNERAPARDSAWGPRTR